MTEVERAKEIAQKIYDSAPQVVKDSVGDDVLLTAILCAESYYKVQSRCETPETATVEVNVDRLIYWMRKRASITFICHIFNIDESRLLTLLQSQNLGNDVSVDDIKENKQPLAQLRWDCVQARITEPKFNYLKQDFLSGYNSMRKEGYSDVDISIHCDNSISQIVGINSDIDNREKELAVKVLSDFHKGRSARFLGYKYDLTFNKVRNILYTCGYIIPRSDEDFNVLMLRSAQLVRRNHQKVFDDFINEVISVAKEMQCKEDVIYNVSADNHPDVEDMAVAKKLAAQGLSADTLSTMLGIDSDEVLKLGIIGTWL